METSSKLRADRKRTSEQLAHQIAEDQEIKFPSAKFRFLSLETPPSEKAAKI